MYVSVRKYKTSSVNEVIRKVNEEFLPMISKAPGFVSYQVVDGGNGAVASISVFESQAGAEESNRMAADWVKRSIAPLMSGPPEIFAGSMLINKKK
jgi:hypothetical protein